MDLIDYSVYRTYKKFDSCERARGPIEATLILVIFFLLFPLVVHFSDKKENDMSSDRIIYIESSKHDKYRIISVDGIQYIQYIDSVAPSVYDTTLEPLDSELYLSQKYKSAPTISSNNNDRQQSDEKNLFNKDTINTIIAISILVGPILIAMLIARIWYPDKKILSLCTVYENDKRNSTSLIFWALLNVVIIFCLCGLEIALFW